MEKKKKVMVTVVTVLVLTIGVTFAYFMARTGAGAQSDLNITADTVDDLKFSVSKDTLTLNINQFNFASGSGNLSDAIKATASLKANSTKKTATSNYYVYFQIESNSYIYTTTDKKPEIILSVTGPNGDITSLDGLTYYDGTTTNGVKGFDITELKSSVIKVADSYEISSSSSTNYTNQDWTFTVTFINLDTNQVDNEGKTLTGKVLIQKDKIVDSVSAVAKNGDALATTLESLGTKGDSSLTGLYHHDSSLTNGAGDNSYRFAGANPNNYVCFGSDDATCPTENLYRIIGLIDGKIKLISADGATTDMLGTDGGFYKTAKDAGMPSNYYKGSTDFSKIGLYYWNSTKTNTWSDSTTNLTNLNTNYLTYLDGKNSKWKNMIADTTWYVGGMTSTNGYNSNAKTAYNYEVGANKDASTTVTSKIGLMYVSDYYYGANPEYWTLPGYDENGTYDSSTNTWTGDDYSKAYSDNWMSTGLYEWTASRVSDDSHGAFGVGGGGGVDWDDVDINLVVRPSFSLTSSVKYESGDGTASSPIRLKL